MPLFSVYLIINLLSTSPLKWEITTLKLKHIELKSYFTYK